MLKGLPGFCSIQHPAGLGTKLSGAPTSKAVAAKPLLKPQTCSRAWPEVCESQQNSCSSSEGFTPACVKQCAWYHQVPGIFIAGVFTGHAPVLFGRGAGRGVEKEGGVPPSLAWEHGWQRKQVKKC